MNPPIGIDATFAPRIWRDDVREATVTVSHWFLSNIHNAYVTSRVLDFMFVHRLGAGRLTADHPWATGMRIEDGTPIWPRNIVYASPRRDHWNGPVPEPDDTIVCRIGAFMAAMVQRSTVAEPEIPQGRKRRMPHAVNLLHGTILYNGAFLIFNDFLDGKYHLSDRRFVREIRRFAREEKRELTVVFRERQYDPAEYAFFVTFLRSRLPWYANPNGPTPKRVLWGTPSPYAAVNPINGSWIGDVWHLTKPDGEPPVRPVVEKGRYFQGEFRGNQPHYSFLVRFHAWLSYVVIALRGFQGGMLFTPRKRIEPENWQKYIESNGRWRPGYAVPHPFRRMRKSFSPQRH
jgi:hypothetical protein